MLRVLAVDDDPAVQRVLVRLLRSRGHAVATADSGEAALATVGSQRPDVVMLDVQMPGIDGLETLAQLRRVAAGVPVIIMTGQGDVDTAVRAFKCGAVDFVVKPFVEAKLFAALDALATVQREAGHDGELAPTPGSASSPTLVGDSPAFREAIDFAIKLARPDINLLLAGETGTGKDLFARTIHASSKRRAGPFVAVDCSTLAENLIESELFGHEKGSFTGAVAARIGHFERADGGTLFLDEVGNLSLHVQAKLLRILQERTMERVGGRETLHLDVRVLSATNVDLMEAVQRGTFRMDLYYRLAEAVITPPPLRERAGDVRRLAKHFVDRYASRFGAAVQSVSPEALARLEAHGWPGNVRELEAVIKVAVALADGVVLPEHLPHWVARASRAEVGHVEASPRPPSVDATNAGGRERIRVEVDVELGGEHDGIDLKALATAAGEKAEHAVLAAMVKRGLSQAQLARLMNIDPKTLRAKLRKYGLDST